MYDLLVFIGRFQPLHLGHQEVIDNALSMSKQVLLLVGSANAAPSPRNPFTYNERRAMIKSVYPQVEVRSLDDHTYNDSAWISEVQGRVKEVLFPKGNWSPDGIKDKSVGLIGWNKDHTSFYLKMFPDWTSVSVTPTHPLSATTIREHYFVPENKLQKYLLAGNMNPRIADWLIQYAAKPEYEALRKEFEYVKQYKKDWGKGPFLTADALVQVGGKILLINRGKEYGHGLYAMPGGFVNENETFKNAAIRELREETNLRVPTPVLRGSIKNSQTFDEPHRSERGRLVTQCFHIYLENDTKLPEVRGGDDADKADWYDISWVMDNPKLFFEDHYAIIRIMLKV